MLAAAAVIALVAAPTVSAADELLAASGADPDRGKHGGYLLEPDYYTNFLLNPYRILASPFRWSAGDWAVAGFMLSGLGVLMFADEPFRDIWQENVRNGTTDDIANIGDTVGQIYTLLPTAGAAFVAGAAIGDRNLQAASLEAFQSLIITAGFVEGLKLATHRARPNESPTTAFNFDGPSLSGSNKSFISGHAAYSFAAASSFASAYPDSVVVPVTAYGLAGISALSRVNDDKHWLTDVLVGGALGVVIGKLVYHTSPFRAGPERRVAVAPYHRRGATGVQVSLKF